MATPEMVGNAKIIRFVTKDRIRLSGILFSRHAGAKTCVIWLHGMTGTMIGNIPFAFASGLGSGLAFFSLNNRGHDCVASFRKVTKGKGKSLIAGTYYEKFIDSVY